MSSPIQALLRAEELPTHWYNLNADFPEPIPPPLHPGTRQPVTPDLLTAIFPENLVAQEMTAERMVEIPQEVRDVYSLLRRAHQRTGRRHGRQASAGTEFHFGPLLSVQTGLGGGRFALLLGLFGLKRPPGSGFWRPFLFDFSPAESRPSAAPSS